MHEPAVAAFLPDIVAIRIAINQQEVYNSGE
jgi:hypothetical protein